MIMNCISKWLLKRDWTQNSTLTEWVVGLFCNLMVNVTLTIPI